MPDQIKLNDGSSIPQLGLGVWQVDPATTAQVVGWAIEAGYRSIDTAEGYRNEEGVGRAIRSAGVPRTELYITSKLRNGAHQRDAALRAFDDTMEKLGIEQIDLFLIHWPVPSQDKYVEAWKTLIELKEAGRIRSIGVSNFNQDHLERIIGETGVVAGRQPDRAPPALPAARQARVPRQAQHSSIESWSPLGSGRLLDDPTIGAIAKKHGKTIAQTIIRWHLQQGLIVIPKSVNKDRIAANFDVFDFELDGEDMKAIEGMDSPDGRTGPNPATASFLF